MSLTGSLARPLLAGIFVSSGVDALRDPAGLAKQADDVAPVIARTLGLPTTDTVTLVRANAAIQVTAGTLLAFGKFRRLSALALAASLVPTTYASHRFWEETDPDERARQQKQFLKNAAVLGGLLLAAGDTGGRPSLPWAARKAASRGLEASAATAGAVGEGTAKLREATKDVGKEVAAGVAVATSQAAVLTRRPAKAAKKARKADLRRRVAHLTQDSDISRKVELSKKAVRRARRAAKKAEVTKRAAAAAKKAADAAQKADLVDLTKRLSQAAEKAADSADLAEFSKRARRAAHRAAKAARKSPLSKRARRAAHRAARAARKSDLSKRAVAAAAKAQQATLHSRDSAVSLARDVADRTREALPIGA